MSLNPTSPVTGAAVTGLTTPGYVFTEDQAPDGNTRKFVITSVTGTQTGVEAHSVASPFYVLVRRPSQVKTLGRINPVTGQPTSIPVNEHRVSLFKGATIAGTVATEAILVLDLRIRTPAGIDLVANDTEELKAALSFFGGFLSANASGLYDLICTNMLK